MTKKYWKRFGFYEKGLVVFFLIGIALDPINKELLGSVIPIEIIGYIFFLSLGLYLGFRLCRYEYTRVWKNMKEDEQKDADINSHLRVVGKEDLKKEKKE